MTENRKICVVTGTRAEYGLLYWLLKDINDAEDLELQLFATGMHLSPEFGLTYRQIEGDGFRIDRKIEILLSSDSVVGTAKGMGLATIGFGEAFAQLQPDVLLVLGDRFEVFSAASAATVARLPIVHLHGGETTEGAFDEALRHSITKMSHIHCTATEAYRRRIIQMGEDPSRIFNVGGMGIDNVRRLKLLDKDELEASMGFKLGERNLLVTFHPVTLEENTGAHQINELLEAIRVLDDTHTIFTMPNADAGGREIQKMIGDYVARNQETSVVFSSLGQLRYLSAMNYVDAVVGNSSSGIIEAPSLKVATVNVGGRQRGRICAESVVHCSPKKDAIVDAIQHVCTPKFKECVKTVVNPYGEGDSSRRVLEILRTQSLDGILCKKFHDLPLDS